MAIESVATKPSRFWELNGKYLISPETRNIDKVNDAGCLLASAESTLIAVMDALEDQSGNMIANPRMLAEMLYGVQYQIQMTRSLVGTISAKEA